MSGASHYEVLGASHDATVAELRRAYLAAAREAHPDVAGSGGEERMRHINEAWATLSDPAKRSAYDLALASGLGATTSGAGASGASAPGAGGVGADPNYRWPSPPPIINNPVRTPFVPYHEHDEDDDDTWRYEPDPTDPETALSQPFQFLPIVLIAIGIFVGIVGAMAELLPVVAVGVICAVLGVVSVVALPLVAMGKAKQSENRSTR